MELNRTNVKDVAGNITSRILIALEMGSLSLTGKGKRIMWEECILNELNYMIDNGVYPSDLENTEISSIR